MAESFFEVVSESRLFFVSEFLINLTEGYEYYFVLNFIANYNYLLETDKVF